MAYMHTPPDRRVSVTGYVVSLLMHRSASRSKPAATLCAQHQPVSWQRRHYNAIRCCNRPDLTSLYPLLLLLFSGLLLGSGLRRIETSTRKDDAEGHEANGLL